MAETNGTQRSRAEWWGVILGLLVVAYAGSYLILLDGVRYGGIHSSGHGVYTPRYRVRSAIVEAVLWPGYRVDRYFRPDYWFIANLEGRTILWWPAATPPPRAAGASTSGSPPPSPSR